MSWRWETRGRGKLHIALALGLAACQRGFRVRFTTAATLAHELIEAKDERRLMRFQKNAGQLRTANHRRTGVRAALSKTGAGTLFSEVSSRRYERAATLVTSNLPFNEWTEAFGSERLTGALLDRLTHHVHILEMNGESYRLKDSKGRRKPRALQSGLICGCRLPLRPKRAPQSGPQAYAPAAPANPWKEDPDCLWNGLFSLRRSGLFLLRP